MPLFKKCIQCGNILPIDHVYENDLCVRCNEPTIEERLLSLEERMVVLEEILKEIKQ